MPDLGFSIPERFNVAEYFVDRNLAEGRGHETAVIHLDRRLTYGDVAEQVNRAANAFKNAGMRPLDRVFLLLLDSPAFVASFWGAIKAGAVPIPTNTLLGSEEIEFMLRDSRSGCLVVDARLLEKVEGVLSQPKGEAELQTVFVTGQTGERPGTLNFELELARQPAAANSAPTDRDDPAFWLYTSGSTGRPKAAIHLHHDMVNCFEHYARGVLRMTASDRTFSTSKLFFAYGLGNALYFPFGAGASTVLLAEKPTPERIVEILAKRRPTVFFSVPTVYAALAEFPDVPAGAFQSVRAAVSAGEALPAPLWERCHKRFGISILDGIGSTEMLHMFLSNRLDDIVPGSSGAPVPGYEARIVDEAGREVATGEVGELLIRGESAAAGYWQRPELTEATFRNAWTATGDKYFRDARGTFWYCGRSDDMMKVSGMWVSPLEVESAILAHPAVAECAVVGVKDGSGLVKPKAFVVAKTGAPLSELEAELEAFLRSRLPNYKLPEWIVRVDSLPRTATGKVQRFKLRSA
ncbi:MAG: benzoate-CoA ligase family protein [Acidobacteria bacterium]|nr:MAG: benzoate-CoA ligase family protein [Acidobacteriota bacterium]